MTNSVQDFMQSYRAAWEQRDLDEIVKMYGLPMLALQADGSRHCLHDEAQRRHFFSAALDRYAATGFEAAELVVDDVIAAGRKVMLVAATWTLKREPGIVLMRAVHLQRSRRRRRLEDLRFNAPRGVDTASRTTAKPTGALSLPAPGSQADASEGSISR
jgi:ketosteroid isomerase-like protein